MPAKPSYNPTGSLMTLVLIYAVFAVAWILSSDAAVEALFDNLEQIVWISTLKGLLFVAVTTLLLYGLVRRLVAQINAVHQHELSERQAAERILKASEQRFYDIAAVSADWIWEVDATGCYTYVSNGVERLLGYTPTEILGRSVLEFMPADEAQRVKGIFTEMAARREILRDFENISLRKNGELCYVLSSGVPIVDAEGQLLGYRGVDRDITARKLAEIELFKSNDELHRFNRASVGRELDMIKLKQQVNALSLELGRKAPYCLAFLKDDS